MKILVTGANGQLGRELIQKLAKAHFEASGASHDDMDIVDQSAVESFISVMRPDMVVNCAAYTGVDDAESEPVKAYAVNQKGPRVIARSCREHHIPLIHISTDFVFDGHKKSPYAETDPVNPLSIYGKSKALGENEISQRVEEHIIIRTSWLYGVWGKNFVKTMLSLGRERKVLTVVGDQFGCPTSASDLADAVVSIIQQKDKFDRSTWGVYHYCGKDVVSWYAFAQAVFKIVRRETGSAVPVITPVSTAQYPATAQRPAYSALDCNKIQERFGLKTIPMEKSLSVVVKRLLLDPKSNLFP